MRIRCVVAPVVNRAEQVYLWNVGDEADVCLTHYWSGLIERGVVAVVEPPAPVQLSLVEAAPEPAPEPEPMSEPEPEPVASRELEPPAACEAVAPECVRAPRDPVSGAPECVEVPVEVAPVVELDPEPEPEAEGALVVEAVGPPTARKRSKRSEPKPSGPGALEV